MSETALLTEQADGWTPTDDAESIETVSRFTGGKTDPYRHAAVHSLTARGKSQAEVCRLLGMDSRTVKAILASDDYLISDARTLLKANALGFAANVVTAGDEAAKRGKLADLLHLTDRLGITDAPKTSAQVQVNTQVILHGGHTPSELVPPAPVIDAATVPTGDAHV
jgi:hypothetical protein